MVCLQSFRSSAPEPHLLAKMRQFFHSGDLGDVIYSLPAIRAMGGGVLWLADQPGIQTMHGMTHARFEAIRHLLIHQPYIYQVNYGVPDSGEFTNLNTFRGKGFNLCTENLADVYLKTEGIPTDERNRRWLGVPLSRHAPIVISRSARYHNDKFPWKKVMDKYGKDAIFVGTPAEHVAFVTEFSAIQHAHTPDLFRAAQIIAGADRFIGNQSCPLAIAHGLGKRVMIEVCRQCPNCIFGRSDEVLGWGDLNP